jgi:hypothetical protein
MLAARLLAKGGYDCQREVRTLEMLKIRFGDAELHHCEVMLRDVAESKRMDLAIRSLGPPREAAANPASTPGQTPAQTPAQTLSQTRRTRAAAAALAAGGQQSATPATPPSAAGGASVASGRSLFSTPSPNAQQQAAAAAASAGGGSASAGARAAAAGHAATAAAGSPQLPPAASAATAAAPAAPPPPPLPPGTADALARLRGSICSHLFWPDLEERELALPPELKAAMEVRTGNPDSQPLHFPPAQIRNQLSQTNQPTTQLTTTPLRPGLL